MENLRVEDPQDTLIVNIQPTLIFRKEAHLLLHQRQRPSDHPRVIPEEEAADCGQKDYEVQGAGVLGQVLQHPHGQRQRGERRMERLFRI